MVKQVECFVLETSNSSSFSSFGSGGTSEDIQEGNGQMKTQKEDDLKPEQEEDTNKKVKESTEPTETTPMIQR